MFESYFVADADAAVLLELRGSRIAAKNDSGNPLQFIADADTLKSDCHPNGTFWCAIPSLLFVN